MGVQAATVTESEGNILVLTPGSLVNLLVTFDVVKCVASNAEPVLVSNLIPLSPQDNKTSKCLTPDIDELHI
uniref:Uncharacterized protein n=1 Tax=Romanomermis culicivorax TaxID=13658 RepID=A0A915KAR1_ROMCU